jgi:hypothetical protein
VSQDQALILAFKVVEVASVVTIVAFVACYSRWARWWANTIGRTIVYKDIALILVLLPSILSIFIDFSRFTSRIAGWFDLCAFALVPVIMTWRIVVFRKIHRDGKDTQRET